MKLPDRLSLASALLLALAWVGSARSAAAAPAADAPEVPVEAVLEVTLSSGGDGESMVVLRAPDGTLYLEEADFLKLRLKLPPTTPYDHAGRRYYAPAAIPGCKVAIDEARQTAVIDAPVAVLDTTHFQAAPRNRPNLTPADPGAFLNYQLSAQQIDGQTTGGFYGDLGLFAAEGVFTNSAVARDDGAHQQLIRLDTTFTRDFPDQLETLNIGDTVSDPGSWGNALHFAGLRFSRNFALRPDLLTTPLLSSAGTAVVPSTVDVFVNHQLVSSSQVPAGPFIVDRLPTVTGTGDVNVVVRDALGREQVVSQSFYSSNSLLAPGLTQYSVDLGSVRDNYAIASDSYGRLLSEASYRRGITDLLTVEGHGEILAGTAHAAGVNAVLGVARYATLNVIVANGGDGENSGWLTSAGIEHRGSTLNFAVSSAWAGSNFTQVGAPLDPALRVHQRTLLQGGAQFGRFGSLSLAYALQTYRAAPAQQTATLTHTLNLGHAGSLNLSLSRTRTAQNDSSPAQAQTSTSFYLIYVYSLGGRRTASATALVGRGSSVPRDEALVGLSSSPPAGPGAGYRLAASSTGDYDADWSEQTSAADVEVEAARNQGIQGRSANLSGALTWLDGRVDATRALTGSFAMVDVAGLADVPVYVDNQLIAHTDASGKALLYNLRPYEANRVSISPEDLPLDTTIAASSTIIAPPGSSGVVARFPVERVRGGTFRLVTADGLPVPAGATVRFGGSEFPVVHDGVVYVTGYDHGMGGEATWAGDRCAFRLKPPPDDDPLPNLGTLTCSTR